MKIKYPKRLISYFIGTGLVALLAFYSLNFAATNNLFTNLFSKQTLSNIQHRDGWKTYHNKLIGYEIKFPSDWRISEESFGPEEKIVTDQSQLIDIFPGDSQKDFLNKITIEAFVDGLSTNSNDTWDIYVNNFKSWNLENKNVGETEINGSKYIFVEGTSIEAGVPGGFSSKTYLTKINQDKGMLAIIVRDKNNPRVEIFDQIVNSFKFE